MKRLIPATILSVAIIIICVGANIAVKTVCNETKRLATECRTDAVSGDFSSAIQKSAELKKQWEDESKILLLFVNHKVCDDLSLVTNRIYYHCLNENTDLIITDISDLETLLHQIVSEQKLNSLSFY